MESKCGLHLPLSLDQQRFRMNVILKAPNRCRVVLQTWRLKDLSPRFER